MSNETPPRLDEDLVFEFVRVAHGSLERVQALLEQEPGLVNACWNWGGDDWETALGAAAHTGQKEIALCLLAHGARMDLLCAAMLGKIEIVQAFISDDPAVVHVPGPHGIPLIAHAQAGGQDEVAALIAAHS
jgi:hypothetical protein